MNLLLDTHTLIWVLDDDRRLPPAVRQVTVDPANSVYASAASVWEISVKTRLGRSRMPEDLMKRIAQAMEQSRFIELPISISHALAVHDLPAIHDDPFDRLLVAQALVEGLTLVTHDKIVLRYPIRTLPA